MKKIIAAALLSSLVLGGMPAQAKKTVDNTKTVGYSYLQSSFSIYDKIQKTIHDYAEPGYQEYKSSKLLADHLAANGFKVEMGVADIPTAFVATFGSGKPVVGLLGEFDALPGMSQDTSSVKHPLVEGVAGHACGHNLLGTGPAAAAVAISKWLAEGHEGTIRYYGCPAEEGGGGKGYMVAAGCFDGCDAVLDFHPSAFNRVQLDPGLANIRVKFTFHGVSSHASGAPWKGRSALDAVEAFDYMVNLMREHVTPEVRIHYVISNGGQAPNVVPNLASVDYYFRAATGDDVYAVFQRALKAAEGAAMGTGTTMTYEIVNGTYERLKNAKLSDIYRKNMIKVGPVVLDEREKEFCREIMRNSGLEPDLSNFETIIESEGTRTPGGASSDAGNVSQVVPLAMLNVSTFTTAGGGHSWQQAAVGGITVGTKGLINVAKIEYLTALDLYQDPSLLIPIWEEYRSFRGPDYKYKQLQGDRKPPLDYCK